MTQIYAAIGSTIRSSSQSAWMHTDTPSTPAGVPGPSTLEGVYNLMLGTMRSGHGGLGYHSWGPIPNSGYDSQEPHQTPKNKSPNKALTFPETRVSWKGTRSTGVLMAQQSLEQQSLWGEHRGIRCRVFLKGL